MRPDGARSRLTLREHGRTVAERDVDTAWLLGQLDQLGRGGETYPALAALLTAST